MAIPLPPNNFTVQQGNGQVLLTWSLVAGALSYSVQRSIDGVVFSPLATPSLNSYIDLTALINAQYYYQVASVNMDGISPYTDYLGIVPTNPGYMTLGQVRDAAQQRADRVNSNFVTFTEWNSYINQSYFELYDLLVTVFEDYYLAPGILLATDGTTYQFPLPNGSNTFLSSAFPPVIVTPPPFYKMWGVDMGLDASFTSNAWFTLRKFDAIERNAYVYPQINSSILGVFNMRYRVVGNFLWCIPTPAGNQFIRIWYIPRVKTLLQDIDILDGVSGWSEYVIVDAAIKALQKEESDVRELTAQKMMLRQRIEETSMNRDVGQPDTISNTRWRTRGGWEGFGFGDGSLAGY